MMLGKSGRYMQKIETRALTYTIHKNKLNMDKKLIGKSWNHKKPRRNQAIKSQTSLVATFLPLYLFGTDVLIVVHVLVMLLTLRALVLTYISTTM